eukprot:364033-Chlamydomonas_euryale.AAC.11
MPPHGYLSTAKGPHMEAPRCQGQAPKVHRGAAEAPHPPLPQPYTTQTLTCRPARLQGQLPRHPAAGSCPCSRLAAHACRCTCAALSPCVGAGLPTAHISPGQLARQVPVQPSTWGHGREDVVDAHVRAGRDLQGAWRMAHGTWHMAHGTWQVRHRARRMGHSAWRMAHGTWLRTNCT